MVKAKLKEIYEAKACGGYQFSTNIPSTIDKFYIPTKLRLDKPSNSGEEVYIDPEDLFHPSKTLSINPERIILQGETGMGKTIITELVLYLWTQEKLPSTIEYAFKVNLKLLLSDWKSIYGDKVLANPVACLVHYSLNQDHTGISFHEVSEILRNHKDKTLLIIDGYDGIARIEERDPYIRKVVDNLLHSSKYLLMTSKPNFISQFRENSFNFKAHLTGFDSHNSKLFIEQYFETQHKELIDIVSHYKDTHPDARTIDLWRHLYSSSEPLEFESSLELKRIISYVTTRSSTPTANADSEKHLSKFYFSEISHIIDAINFYYTNIAKGLHNLLNNPTIRDLASNPLNAQMLCLAASDPEISVQSASKSIDKLYQIVIGKLGERLDSPSILSEPNEDTAEQKTSIENSLNRLEFKALRELAHFATNSNNILQAKIVNDIAQKHGTNVHSLIKSGLLKIATRKVAQHENLEEDMLHLTFLDNFTTQEKYIFSHLSIQEYFAAYHLKEMLLSSDSKLYMEAAELVANHRNEPQYLMLFKFLAGMLSHLPNTKESNLAITRFWEAVECNIEGVLELGVAQKAVLFMNLLTQTIQQDGNFDQRIPNLHEVIDFIDKVVLHSGNLIKWQDRLANIGYMSVEMRDYLWKILEDHHNSVHQNSITSSSDSLTQIQTEVKEAETKEQDLLEPSNGILTSLTHPQKESSLTIISPTSALQVSNESPRSLNSNDTPCSPGENPAAFALRKKAMIEFAGNMLNEIDNVKLYNVLSAYLTRSSNADWSVIKSSINVITKIIQHQDPVFLAATETSLIYTIKLLISFIHDPNLKDSSIHALKIFKDVNIDDSRIIQTLFNDLIKFLKENIHEGSLNQLIYSIIIKAEPSDLNLYLDELIDILKSSKLAAISPPDGERSQSDEETIQFFMDTPHNSAYAIIKDLVKFDNNIARLIITKLVTVLNSEISKISMASIIGKLLMASSHETQQDIFSKIMENLHDDRAKNTIITTINAGISEDQEIGAEFSKGLLTEFTIILQNLDKQEAFNKFNIIDAITKVAKIAESITTETRELVYSTLLDHTDLPNTPIALAYIVPIDKDEYVINTANILIREIQLDNNNDEALIALTTRTIENALAKHILDNLIPLLNTTYSVAIPIANLLKKLSDVNEKMLDDIGDKLIKQIQHLNYFKIISALKIIMQSHEEIKIGYITALINHLDKVSSLDIKCEIIKLITVNINIESSHLAQPILEHSYSLLYTENSNSRILAKSIAILARVFPEESNPFIKNYILNKLEAFPGIATLTLSNILKDRDIPSDDHHLFLLENMIKLLNHKEAGLNSLNAILSILKRETDHEFIAQITTKLIGLMHSISNRNAAHSEQSTYHQEASYSAYILSKMMQKVTLADETLTIILHELRLLEDPYLLKDVKQSMHRIIESISIEKSIQFLKIPCLLIREATYSAITKKILNDDIGITWGDKISNLLSIIGNDIESSDEAVLRLYDTAQRKLLDLSKEMDTNEVNLAWVVKHFNELVKISKSESEKLMDAIFYHVLSDNKITPLETKFIKLCIDLLGFSIEISIPPSTTSKEVVFTLRYGNKTHILSGEENRQHIKEIGAILQKSIENNIPFTNSGSANQQAAIDIETCNSLIDNTPIHKGTFQGYYIYLSNDMKTDPQPILLLETRKQSGHYCAHKVLIDIAGKVKIIPYVQHPDHLNDPAFRKKVFGPMLYEGATKPRAYISKSFKISHSDAEKLLASAPHEDEASGGPSDLHSAGSLSVGHPTGDHSKTAWSMFIESVFGVRNNPSTTPPSPQKVTRLSKKTSDFSEVPQKLYDFLVAKSISLPPEITGSFEEDSNSEYYKEWRRDELELIDIERRDSNEIARKELLEMHNLKRKAQAEIAKIKTDPYKYAFYIEFIQVLNAVYTVCLTDKSGMISTQDPESTADAVGSAIESVSPYIPIAGVGAAILGQILQGVGDAQKQIKFNNFIKFFEDQEKAKIIIEKVARTLVISNLVIERDPLKSLILTSKQIMQGGVKSVASQVASAAISFMEEPIDYEILRGESDGNIVARFTIAKIFEGSYSTTKKTHFRGESSLTEKEKAYLIINAAKDQFTNSIKPLLSLSASALDDLPTESSTEVNSPAHIQQPNGYSVKSSPAVETTSCSHCIVMRVEIDYDTPFNRPEYQAIFKLTPEKRDMALYIYHQSINDPAIKQLGMETFFKVFSEMYLKPNEALTPQLTIASEPNTASDSESLSVIEYAPSLSFSQGVDITSKPSVTPSFSMLSFTDLLNPNFLLKKLLYPEEIQKLGEFFEKEGMKVNLENDQEIKKALLKYHPDKGGNPELFKFVTEIRDKLKPNLWQDLHKALESQFRNIESALLKTSISFKILDTTVDAARLAHKPSIDNGKSVLLDLNYLYSMSYGPNKVSLAINYADIAYKAYQGQINAALTQAGITAGYMIIPALVSTIGGPYATLAYSVVITGHSGYQAIKNAYSFYNEYSESLSPSEEPAFIMAGVSNSTEAI